MFARIEVVTRPEWSDVDAGTFLSKVEMVDPGLRKSIRWARCLQVYWIDLAVAREDLLFGLQEILRDPVSKWIFSGNLLPSGAGKKGSIEDLLEMAPNRPGVFHGIEKRSRLGALDLPARSLYQAFQTVLRQPLSGGQILSGSLVVLEGPDLSEEKLRMIAKKYFAGESLESWTLHTEKEVTDSERFHPERIRREMHRDSLNPSSKRLQSARFIGNISSGDENRFDQTQDEYKTLSRRRGFKNDYERDTDLERVAETLGRHEFTSFEWEVMHRLLDVARSEVRLKRAFRIAGPSGEIAHYKDFIEETFFSTLKQNPREWVLERGGLDRPALLKFDEQDVISWAMGNASRNLWLDPEHATEAVFASTILSALMVSPGFLPIGSTFNLLTADVLERSIHAENSMIPHPRQVLLSAVEGAHVGTFGLGVPVLSGMLHLESFSAEAPWLMVEAFGFAPSLAEGMDEREEEALQSGDLLFYSPTFMGRDGAPNGPAVDRTDRLLLKRFLSWISEARRNKWILKQATPVGGGFAELALQACRSVGGLHLDLSKIPIKRPAPTAYDIFAKNQTDGVMFWVKAENTLATERSLSAFGIPFGIVGTAKKDGLLTVEASDLGSASFPLSLFNKKDESFSVELSWQGPSATREREFGELSKEGVEILLRALSHPNLSSREWIIRSLDHEVLGYSALKPLHTIGLGTEGMHSGPNDAGISKFQPSTFAGMVSAHGFQPSLYKIDPRLSGMRAVDEAIRNALCVGAEFGSEESRIALGFAVHGSSDPEKTTDAGWAIACEGATFAATQLQVPFVSGSWLEPEGQKSSCPLIINAVGRVQRLNQARSADFKSISDHIYLLGSQTFSLEGSRVGEWFGVPKERAKLQPDWSLARRIYAWLGGSLGKEQRKLKSLHDVSCGGLLVALAECCLARGLGADIEMPSGLPDHVEWEFLFGEGFHSFVVSTSEIEAPIVEGEMKGLDIPYVKLGTVLGSGVFQVARGNKALFSIETKVLRAAWKKDGYWE